MTVLHTLHHILQPSWCIFSRLGFFYLGAKNDARVREIRQEALLAWPLQRFIEGLQLRLPYITYHIISCLHSFILVSVGWSLSSLALCAKHICVTCSSLLTPASPQAGHGEKAAGEPPQDLKRSQPVLQLMGAHCRVPTALLTFPVIIVDCLMDVCTIGSYYTLILNISDVWFARARQGHDTSFFLNIFFIFLSHYYVHVKFLLFFTVCVQLGARACQWCERDENW